MNDSVCARKLVWMLLAGYILAFITPSAFSAAVVFTLDESKSSVTASGTVAGFDVREQDAGSLTASFGGSIRAVLTPTSILFPGGSFVDAKTNGVWQPKPGGEAGTAPADFGGEVSTLLGFIPGSFRNIVLDVTSSSLTLTNGAFDASQLAFTFGTNSIASFDYDAGFLGSGSRTLAGLAATNKVGNAATLVTTGEVQTLTIKVDSDYAFRAFAANDSLLQLKGQLVAVRTNSPLIQSIQIANQQIVLSVEGLGAAPARVESSSDLKTWAERASTATNETGRTVFNLTGAGPIEFYRIIK